MRKQRAALEKETYYLADDMTKEDMMTKRQLQPVIQKARNEDKKFRFTKGRLYIEGKLYNPKYDNIKKDSADAKKSQGQHMDGKSNRSGVRHASSPPQKPKPHSQTPTERSTRRHHATPPLQTTPPSQQQQHNMNYQQHQYEQQPQLPQPPSPPQGGQESQTTQGQEPVTGEVPVQNNQ